MTHTPDNQKTSQEGKKPETPLKRNLERLIFFSLAGILLIVMPLLSLKSGISGDEETFHFPHGKNTYNYYATMGKDTTCLYYNNSVLHMYGPVFDLSTVVAIKMFKSEDPYKIRHVFNSLAGWTAILFAGLLAALLGGWRTGIFTMFFLFITPPFLGHSFNNPKDIPFAAAYIFTLWAIIRFLKNYPNNLLKYAWPIALGIGISIGVRVGGVLLIFYFFLIAGLYYLIYNQSKTWFNTKNLQFLSKLMLVAGLISIVGFSIGIALWPYGHQAPIANTFGALKYMEAYGTSLRQVFEGNIIWSDNVPKYYLPKYIFITIPVIVIIGLLLCAALIKTIKKKELLWYAIILFVATFPIAYAIYKNSNVYGAWRHMMFIYPPLVILAATGFGQLFNILKNKYLQYGLYLIMAILSIGVIKHNLKNHPNQYVYYNALVGGVDKALGVYEMDYFYHSMRSGCDWLIENEINKNVPKDKTIIIASNHSNITQYYFRNYPNVKVRYVRYYERGESDWDYAIIVNSYLSPYQLQRKIWPPETAIKSINVDNAPVCAVLKRKQRDDLAGTKLLSANNPQEAIPYFLKVINAEPKNEAAYLNLSKAYMGIGDYNNAIKYGSICLKYYKNYEQALYQVGLAYRYNNQLDYAIGYFKNSLKANPKYFAAYYYLGEAYAQKNELNKALEYLDKAIQQKGDFKPAYILSAQIFEMQGNHQAAKRYMDAANSIR